MSDGLTLVLAGRTFCTTEHTRFDQDIYLMQHVRAAGLDDLPSDRKGPTLTKAVLERVLASGRTMQILAGTLVEVGQAWTPQAADDNARFFAALTAREDKQALHRHLVAVLALFFVNGESSSETSRSSSPARKGSAMPGERRSAAADPSISASGERRSESSPATTRRGSRKSSRGRSAKASSRSSRG